MSAMTKSGNLSALIIAFAIRPEEKGGVQYPYCCFPGRRRKDGWMDGWMEYDP